VGDTAQQPADDTAEAERQQYPYEDLKKKVTHISVPWPCRAALPPVPILPHPGINVL
jgi:hypothetical protein